DRNVTGVQTCALPISQAPLAGEMSGHMFFGGDWYGFDDALFAAARLLRYVAELGGPLSRHFADLPATVSTPELRVDCPDDQKFRSEERRVGKEWKCRM